ncbi:MAG: hypothetical protein JSW34_02980 [Candidatus Zixiibacteriota bacterium]|nr:MAG: hypothetical protein JSW34_02980 [candidate division Zixibacteria bacterium]
MTLRRVSAAFLAVLFLATSVTVQAADMKAKQRLRIDTAKMAVAKTLGYSFAPEDHTWPSGDKALRLPLGVNSYTSASESPGVEFGATYYDYQHNNSMGRMIGIGPHSGVTGPAIVHFSWMYLPDSVFESRSYAYNAYISSTHSFVGPTILHDPDHQYSGYVNIDVTSDNRAVIGGHCDLMTGPQHYMGHFHFDECQGCADFANYYRIPDSLGAYDQLGDQSAMWPKFLFQFGADTVLHSITKNWEYYGALMYCRNVGYEGTGEWDYPPYLPDTVQCYAHDLTGIQMGNKVAIAWLASPPYQQPSCDTCSGLTIYDTYLVGQYDNDVYYQISTDQGLNWEPKQNVTKIPIGEAHYKAYCDLSVVFDQSGYFHIVWNATPFPADTCIEEGGWCFTDGWWWDPTRIFHYSENVPYIRTVTDQTYLPSDSCGPPHFWTVQAAKMSISECDNKLYCLYTQFNDIPNGIDDDCAQWGYDMGLWAGPANGDLWITVSSDGGMTWDAPRNLTNSYTPHCEPYVGADCESDYWASMTRWGRQTQTGEDWSGAVIVDPSGGESPTDYYLDIQYVNDRDAGAVIWEEFEGTWTYNAMKWFRIPCVEPIAAPNFVPSFWFIGDPAWGKPTIPKDTTLVIENLGNTDLTYDITVVEDNGPTGWLTYSGFSGSTPSGLYNTEEGTVHLNTGGIVDYETVLYGRLTFTGNDPDFPSSIEIEYIVADTVHFPAWDVVNTSCLALTCSNHGSTGRAGRGEVNMDFYPEDCDTTALLYLYEGTPLLARNGGTEFNYILWGNSFTDDDGLRPQGGHTATKACATLNAEVYESGTFTDQDTSVAFEKIWVAPSDDCEYIIEYMRVWSFDNVALTGLTLGELVDWDIPYDALPDDSRDWMPFNTGGIDPGRNLLYQQGYECYCDDTLYPNNCVYNDTRFGGTAFIQSYLNGTPRYSMPYSGWVGENEAMFAPDEGFIYANIWTEMMASGLRGTDSTEDLHVGLCFEPGLDLGASDYYEVVTVLAAVETGALTDLQAAIDRANSWFAANGGVSMFADVDPANGDIDVCETCCQNMGDIEHSGQVDALDVIFFVDWLWTPGSAEPPCLDEVDVNGDGQGDALDLIYLAEYIFQGMHDPLPDCP